MTSRWIMAGLAGLCLTTAQADVTPRVHLRELPDNLRQIWRDTQPQMTESSRCAAAFDSHSDPAKMSLQCSVYIRMGAEGERRAMRYCEEKRQELQIKAPCRVVIE